MLVLYSLLIVHLGSNLKSCNECSHSSVVAAAAAAAAAAVVAAAAAAAAARESCAVTHIIYTA